MGWRVLHLYLAAVIVGGLAVAMTITLLGSVLEVEGQYTATTAFLTGLDAGLLLVRWESRSFQRAMTLQRPFR
jgi:hypothetical protein